MEHTDTKTRKKNTDRVQILIRESIDLGGFINSCATGEIWIRPDSCLSVYHVETPRLFTSPLTLYGLKSHIFAVSLLNFA